MKLAASGAGEDEEKALATSNPISPVNSQTQIMVSGMDEREDMEDKRDNGRDKRRRVHGGGQGDNQHR